jgi:hypothetical protein
MTNLTFTNQTILNVLERVLTTMRNSFNYDVPGKYYAKIFSYYTRDLNNEAFFDIGAHYGKYEGGYRCGIPSKTAVGSKLSTRLTYGPRAGL